MSNPTPPNNAANPSTTNPSHQRQLPVSTPRAGPIDNAPAPTDFRTVLDVGLPAEAVQLVDDVVHELVQCGVKATGRVGAARGGEVGSLVVEAAHDGHADTIVVGSRRLTDADALLLGSVTHDIIRQFRGCVVVAR